MGTVGRCCVVPEYVGQALSSKHTWTITLDQELYSPYLAMLQVNYSPWVLEHFARDQQGGTMAAIRSETLRSTLLPTPPREEQRLMEGRLREISKKIDLEVDACAKMQEEKSGLKDDLLPAASASRRCWRLPQHDPSPAAARRIPDCRVQERPQEALRHRFGRGAGLPRQHRRRRVVAGRGRRRHAHGAARGTPESGWARRHGGGAHLAPPLAVQAEAIETGGAHVARIVVPSAPRSETSGGVRTCAAVSASMASPNAHRCSPRPYQPRLCRGALDVSAQPIEGATLTDFDPLERERLRQNHAAVRRRPRAAGARRRGAGRRPGIHRTAPGWASRPRCAGCCWWAAKRRCVSICPRMNWRSRYWPSRLSGSTNSATPPTEGDRLAGNKFPAVQPGGGIAGRPLPCRCPNRTWAPSARRWPMP